jgi:pantoate--beta-alanine ligase
MYPKGYNTFIYVNKVTEGLCGASRPLHFRGVCTVVAKLFNICTPTRAYFGQKDFQQTVAVRKMIDDLNMDIGMTVCPTVREDDGLAMSSRNTYLTKEQRAVAPVIYKALQTAKEKINSGETSCEDIKKVIADTLRQNKDISIEYIEIRRQKDLAEIEMIVEDAVIAVAVRLGKTRLIDNILVGGRHNEDHCS